MATDDKTEQNRLPPQDEAKTEHTSSPPQDGATAYQEHFRLLDLPLELVVRVLGFALVFKQEDQFTHHKIGESNYGVAGYSTSFHFWAQPAITRTCHLLRNEGIPMFYSSNQFSLTGSDGDAAKFWKWVSSRSVARRCIDKMQRVHIMITGPYGECLPAKLRSMTWDDFLGETNFQNDYRTEELEPRAAFVAIVGTKVKLAFTESEFGGCAFYQLSLTDHTADGKEWRNIDRFQDPVDTDDEDVDEREVESFMRKDWWVEEPRQA